MKIEQFRQSRADDLITAAKIIESVFSGSILTTPIYIAAEELRKGAPFLKDGTTNDDLWGYEICDLIIPVDTTKHMRPKGINHKKVELILNMKLVANYKNWNDLNDPLIDLNFNAVIRGIGDQPHYFCFHIDKHDPSKVATEPHPTYHLQIASNPLDEDEFQYGNTLFLDTPRIVHHPVDLILGIGLLTSNFFPFAFDNIMDDGYFSSIYKVYQNKILKPYYHTIASNWTYDIANICWSKQHLCPTII